LDPIESPSIVTLLLYILREYFIESGKIAEILKGIKEKDYSLSMEIKNIG
jgi:hypothetical protein